MTSYAFSLLNVFAEMTFGGNPLCVFEEARVRIFTPGHEMHFAGHPALGGAQVVRDIARTGNALTLEFKAGVVPVEAEGDVWTFTAPQRYAARASGEIRVGGRVIELGRGVITV